MKTRRYFGTMSFYKTAIALAVPVMLQTLVQNLVSLIDNFMVAGLGDVKMSGVNVTNQIMFVLFVAYNTLAMASGMFMSQFNGAKNPDGMRHTFRFKILSTALLSAVATTVCALFPAVLIGGLLQGNSAREAIIGEGTKYLGIILFTFFPMGIAMSIGSAFREIGKVRPPLVISVIATLINTFLNWVLIYGNLGAPRLEVQGAAYATLAARTAEALMFIAYMAWTKPDFYVRLRDLLKVNVRIAAGILRKSGIIFLTEMTWAGTETVMTAVFNGRGGAEVVSGMSAGWAIANIFFLAFGAVHTSTGVIVGGTLGRNELDLARTQARWLRTGSIFLGLAVAAVEATSVLLIPIVFGNLSIDAQTVTTHFLWVISFYMPTWTFINAQFATARSGGDAIMGAWVDVTVNLAVLIPLLFLLARLTAFDPITLFALVKTTDFLKVAVAAWQLRKERWVRNLAAAHAEGGEQA